jgi:hypothetical protein
VLPPSRGNVKLRVEEVPIITPTPPTLEQNICRWTKEDCDILYWYYVQSAQSNDSIGNIRKMYVENGASNKNRVAVSYSFQKLLKLEANFNSFQIIEQLYTQDIIMHSQYLELLKQETVVSFKVYMLASTIF